MPVHPSLVRSKLQPGRVDWEKRDLQLAEEVGSAANHIKSLPGTPVRLTISALGRETGRLALIQQHLDKLPRTAHTIGEVIETREAFAVRRLCWVAEDCHQRHIYPQKWQLIRMAGVELLADLPDVKETVNTLLRAISRNEGTEDDS